VLARSFWRRTIILLPIGLVILSFVTLASSIGFKLFPSGDNPNVTFAITAREGTATEAMTLVASGIDRIFAPLPEIKSYTISVRNNTIDI
jgi:multidrug efflux pump subunit AcrB